MRIFSMHFGFNMDIKDFALLWDFDDDNNTLMNYYIKVRNIPFELKNFKKDEIWKINNKLNEEIHTCTIGYIDFDNILLQATERNVIYNANKQ